MNPSSAYVDPKLLKSSTSKQGELKGKYKDKGMVEYSLNQIMYLRQLIDYPKDYGRPHPSKQAFIIIIKWDPTIFKKWGEMEEEDIYKMLYKEPGEEFNQDHITIPCENYGKGFKF